jgi:hypothetical protein
MPKLCCFPRHRDSLPACWPAKYVHPLSAHSCMMHLGSLNLQLLLNAQQPHFQQTFTLSCSPCPAIYCSAAACTAGRSKVVQLMWRCACVTAQHSTPADPPMSASVLYLLKSNFSASNLKAAAVRATGVGRWQVQVQQLRNLHACCHDSTVTQHKQHRVKARCWVENACRTAVASHKVLPHTQTGGCWRVCTRDASTTHPT